MNDKQHSIRTSIAPWLSVHDGAAAVGFYKAAFDAVETYHLEIPGNGLVARLSIKGADFWINGGASSNNQYSPKLPGGNIRMILTAENVDDLFSKALKAGASEVFPVGEQHGWRLGRIVDPFGFHWEIGHPLPG